MKIACIDKEQYALDNFKYMCKDIEGIESVECFDNYIELLNYLKYNDVALVFSDIELQGITGLELIKYIKGIDDAIEVVYLTAEEKYALQAFEVGAFGYILKPYTSDKLQAPIEKMKRLYFQSRQKIVDVKAFGRFDVFINGKSVIFKNKKAKELLALLIDRRGGVVTMEQAIDVLWEDRPMDDSTKTLYRIASKSLRDTLAQENCADILIESRGQKALNLEKIKCDYFDFVSDPMKYRYLFNGEYMSEYSWGEYSVARLFNMLNM